MVSSDPSFSFIVTDIICTTYYYTINTKYQADKYKMNIFALLASAIFVSVAINTLSAAGTLYVLLIYFTYRFLGDSAYNRLW